MAALVGAAIGIQSASQERCAKRLAELDQAFSANDLQRVSACLAPSGGCALFASAARKTFEGSTVLSRQTEVLRSVSIGGTDAIYARVTTLARPKTAKGTPFDRRFVEPMVFFFVSSPSGPALGRVEYSNFNTLSWLDQAKITCPPCSWTVKRPEGWFLVPHIAREGSSFDAFSLVHPALDLSVDFDVYTATSPAKALDLAERDQRMLAQTMDIRASEMTTVARHASTEDGLDRGDLVVDVAGPAPAPTVRFQRCYRRLGPFVYAFVAHGDAKSADRAAADVHSIVEGLELLAPARDVAGHIERVAKFHSAGGVLDGARYANTVLGVVFDGPPGWTPTELPGQGRFRVQYQCPDDELTRVTFLAREGESNVYGESAVEKFFRDREASLPKEEYRDHRVLRREASLHPNKIDALFEVEAEWTDATDTAMREWLAAIPSGRILYGVCARGPKATFDSRRDAIAKAIASFAHTLGK